jgi:hypothetical protein
MADRRVGLCGDCVPMLKDLQDECASRRAEIVAGADEGARLGLVNLVATVSLWVPGAGRAAASLTLRRRAGADLLATVVTSRAAVDWLAHRAAELQEAVAAQSVRPAILVRSAFPMHPHQLTPHVRHQGALAAELKRAEGAIESARVSLEERGQAQAIRVAAETEEMEEAEASKEAQTASERRRRQPPGDVRAPGRQREAAERRKSGRAEDRKVADARGERARLRVVVTAQVGAASTGRCASQSSQRALGQSCGMGVVCRRRAPAARGQKSAGGRRRRSAGPCGARRSGAASGRTSWPGSEPTRTGGGRGSLRRPPKPSGRWSGRRLSRRCCEASEMTHSRHWRRRSVLGRGHASLLTDYDNCHS